MTFAECALRREFLAAACRKLKSKADNNLKEGRRGRGEDRIC